MIRVATLLLGLAIAAYGGLRLADLGWQNFQGALTWLVAGVLLHDAVLAPLTVAVAWVALRIAGTRRLGPWAVGLVLLGPLTLLAVPVLGRFGARADNPTLLDRPYWAGWTGVVAMVCAGILVTRWAQGRRTSRPVADAPERLTPTVPETGGVRGPGDGRR